MAYPQTVTIFSINRALCKVTLLKYAHFEALEFTARY